MSYFIVFSAAGGVGRHCLQGALRVHIQGSVTVWLLFGQIKAKTREAGSDTVAEWKLCNANWAEFSQKHLGPLRSISLEILRPDNWMKLYTSPSYSFLVTVQIITSWLWSSPQSAFYLLHWDPRIKGWHPSYIHHSTYTVPVGPWGVGKKFSIPSCRAQAFSDEGCFLRRSLLEFLLGLGANCLPMLHLGK